MNYAEKRGCIYSTVHFCCVFDVIIPAGSK